jgi:hypothetical protein
MRTGRKLSGAFFEPSYRAQQVLIESEEGRTSARRSVELLIQQRHELIPGLSVSEEPADLPPIHPAKDQVVEQA